MTANEVLLAIALAVVLYALAVGAPAALWRWWDERQPRAVAYVRCGYPGCDKKIDWKKAYDRGWDRKEIYMLKAPAEHPEWVYIDVCPEHRKEFTP